MKNYSFEVVRIFKVKELPKITAETKRVFVGSATISVNGVAINNCAVTRSIEKKKLADYHFNMPQVKGKDGNYYNVCWLDGEKEEMAKIYKQITKAIEEAFEDDED